MDKTVEQRVTELEQTMQSLRASSSIPFDVGEAFRDRLIKAVRLPIKTTNVSNPPTDGELDTAFGFTPAEVGDGFVGLVDDNGSGAAVWLVTTTNGKWWYELLTAAT